MPLPPPIGCGATNSENELAGAYINPFTFVNVVQVVGPVNGSCGFGSYLRIGMIMALDFTGCTATVSGPPASALPGGHPTATTFAPPADIRVVGLVVPDVTKSSNGVVTPIMDAIFYGVGAGDQT
jgi:hypothetical protein